MNYFKKNKWLLSIYIIINILLTRESFSQSEQKDPVVSDIKIDMMSQFQTRHKYKEIAEGIIFLKQGKPFSPVLLDQSIKALKASGIFKDIHVTDSGWDHETIQITFYLTPFRRIKDIKIKKAFPLFEREIINAMTIHTGDTFIEKKLPSQEKIIKNIFKDAGFISPEIYLSSVENTRDGNIILNIEISKGDFYKISDVRINGNDSLSNLRLKARLKTWKPYFLFSKFRRLIQSELDKDIKNLKNYYREKKYADVEVNTYLEKNEEKGEVIVFFNIDEGPLYNIDFQGHNAFWKYTLKKDLTLFDKGNKNDFGIKKSIRNLRKRYHDSGYLKVKIKTEDTLSETDGKKTRNINFIIDEGPRSVVESVHFEGNKSLTDKIIYKQVKTDTSGIVKSGSYSPKNINNDVNSIESLYLKHGYLDTKVKKNISWIEEDIDEKKNQAIVTFNIEEGEQTRVEAVHFKNLTVISEDEALDKISLKKGSEFREYMIRSDESSLTAVISEMGYPHVKVAGSSQLNEKENSAEIIFTLEEGPHVQMGQFYFTGNFRTKEKTLIRETSQKEGEPFSLAKLLESQRDILNMDAIDSVRMKSIGLQEKADEINVIVDVEEKKPYFFQFGGGYDTERKFYINTKIGDKNLLGLNKNLQASIEISQIGYIGDIKLTEPSFFGTKIYSTFDLYGEKREEFNQDFGTESYGISAGFRREIIENLSGALVFRYEHKEQYPRGSGEFDSEDLLQYEPRSILVTTPGVIYNSTDSFVKPRKGIYSRFSVDISKGIENTLDDFYKYRLEAKYYYSPLDRLTFALRARLGYIDPYGEEDIVPDDQLFFLGGTSTIRGYDENMFLYDLENNPLGGMSETLGNIEARFDLGLNVELTCFYDIGALGDTLISESKTFRSSVGIGLSYQTPIGPVGIIYGWKLDKRRGESADQIHFSIGYTF